MRRVARYSDGASRPVTRKGFLQLPQATRLAYCSYENRDLPALAAVWADSTKNSLDKLPVLNGQNSVQELLIAANYNIRSAWLSHQGGDVVLDALTADKVESCAWTRGDTGPAEARKFAALDKAYADGQAGQAPGTYAHLDVLQTPPAGRDSARVDC